MKRHTLAAAMILAAFCGCEKENGIPATEQWPALSEGIVASASYLGDYYESGTGVINITLRDEGLKFDEDLQSYIGPGKSLTLSLGVPLANDASSPEIPEGQYLPSGDESHPAWTFCTAGLYMTTINSYDTEGNISVTPVTGGTVNIKASGSMYWISCNLTTSEGVFTLEYVGRIRISNMSSEGFVSTLTGDIVCPPMEYAEFTFNGQAGDGIAESYTLFLATGYNPLDGSFEDGFLICLNAEPGLTEVQDGTYVVNSSSDASEQKEGTIVPGYGAFIENMGTWFFCYSKGSSYAQIKSGQMVIRSLQDGSSSISLDFKDGNGHSMTASFMGTPVYY